MTRAIDPFEEFLRKKKVELLEQRYRKETEPPPEGEEGEPAPPGEEQAQEERIREEMDEFFQTGQEAGAEYFSKMETDISEEKVEEIKDALEEVFEEGMEEGPQTEEKDETFVQFFKQVQTAFPDRDGIAAGDPGLADEVVQPDTEPHVAEVVTPLPEPAPEEEPVAAERRRSLAEILLAPAGEAELGQRVELLSRLVVKLLERGEVPEHELVEVLIKSGVEF